MNKPKFYVFLWIAGIIMLGYAMLNTGSRLALDINLHDTYFVIKYNFLAILSIICLVLILWIANKIKHRRSLN